ncbi:MAG TPA: glycosyltransferase family 1 protein, partial [Blastocatellia bacterium]
MKSAHGQFEGMRLITIVTGLPPRIDGIGDYALSMACRVQKDTGIETHFIVGDPAWDGPSSVEGFQVSKLTERSCANLLRMLARETESASIVLLHYGGYGYAMRGCPVWLVDGLRRWRNETEGRLLITMFHELYASGPPWTSAFWLSPLQKRLAASLAQLSDEYFTSSQHYAEMICKLSLGKHGKARSLPVFSSVGEPCSVSPLIERSRRLVIFGTPGRRAQAYRRSAAALNRICDELGIEEILDIGRAIDFDPSQMMRVPVKTCGELPQLEVSRYLSDAVAGALDYPVSVLSKSTIFAAYCAH